jgi:hypothetical protein
LIRLLSLFLAFQKKPDNKKMVEILEIIYFLLIAQKPAIKIYNPNID